MIKIQKPQEGEFAPYAAEYISLLPDDGMVLTHLLENSQKVVDLIASFPAEKLSTPSTPGEWTVKEILLHIMDTERVFCYRALCFSRGDTTEMQGYDQNAYIAISNVNQRDIKSLLDEYTSMRNATVSFFMNIPTEALIRKGIANKYPLSVRAAAYMIAGHELHHVKSIREHYAS